MISVKLQPGTYVLAVSGGVDSMVLLDVVRKLPQVRLIVAHVNHGVREDATQDEQLVESIAMSHNIIYESTSLQLGPDASEEVARMKRYEFLQQIRKKYNALAILTAHHLDDLIETAIINMLRGTGWRGLCSLRSTAELVRPFLDIPKAELVRYAEEHNLQWRYDTTNDDMRYLRNRVRRMIVPKLPRDIQESIYQYIVRQNNLAGIIDSEVSAWLSQHVDLTSDAASLPRYHFIMISSDVAHELLQHVLRRTIGHTLPRPLVARALLFIKVAKEHKTFPLTARWQLRALPRKIIVEPRSDMIS